MTNTFSAFKALVITNPFTEIKTQSGHEFRHPDIEPCEC